ncbi:hypothetical protein EYF80_038485 [Liparis tanakae]|uniref:Uncharacterized protein n=1 Tax=Liparis tanakae TaxID=230148 RepID=A0A4Z2GDQ8_9TELE|nr:hypothetical protein EYF80_038485 [Liparis tanakae]
MLRADSASDSSRAISFRILQPASAAATASGPWTAQRKRSLQGCSQRSSNSARFFWLWNRVVEEVFQHFGDLDEGEAGFSLSRLGRVVPGWTGYPPGSEQELLLFILFEEQVVEEALLRHRPVELLQAAVGHELAQVHAVVHKEAHKVGFVVDERVHHDLFKVACL